MFSIEENYKYVNDILSKNSGEGVFPDEYNRVAHQSQKDAFKIFLGSNNKTVNGQSRVVYGRNQILDTRLQPFRRTLELDVTDNIVIVPSDCAHIRSVRTLDNTAIKRTDDDRIGMILNDPLAKPDDMDMYYLEQATTIELFTESPLSKVKFEYIKYPTPVKYAYTPTGVRGRPVFDPTNSIDYEWNETEEQEITTRILQRFGLEFRDGHIQNYTNIQKAQE